MFDLLGQVDLGKLANWLHIVPTGTPVKTSNLVMGAFVHILYIISQICLAINLF